ncbi:zinc protease [Colletotrichum sojae]|uniref:Zinc protease n=1 Tax=Colletotrichum sojae TaxID=2175907 RepID=A0A8H6ILZ2_9PEZI|nr:zinc protease [Colletotrichum sojae]
MSNEDPAAACPRNLAGPHHEPRSQSVERVTDQLETPLLDNRTYRVVRLSNKLEALLVHDPETDKASAALDVNVGNFSDEEEMPGMAHAVEHLLFMGTKKFPIENEYSQYLASNSGSSNAYTGATSTNYFFDVSAKSANDEKPSASNPSAFRGALDRFAQFFIDPLFLESTLDRELRAVDSEHKKNLQNDAWRLRQLEKSLSNPKHPFCHFATGNIDVLKVQPEAKGIDVRAKFMEFHEKHYSANRMKLVVLGREPLDVLEDWVAEFFSGVPNKNLPPNRWENEVPFRESELGSQVFAKPVMDSRSLNLYFPFLDEEEMFECQARRYVSHLISHKGHGSIIACLKGKGWANYLSANAAPVCPGSPGIFNCQVQLTEAGLKNYKEIVEVFFQYVSLLRESPPQKWIFDELEVMTELNFKFKEKTPSIDFTSKISSIMQKPLSREWLLSGYSRLRKFDAQLIEKGLACLRPDNFRMTIVSQKFPGDWNAKEKWYGTEYRHETIPDNFMTEIIKAASSTALDRLRELYLPSTNEFIPTSLEVGKGKVIEPDLSPRLIRNDDFARAWFKKDDTFCIPKANLYIMLRNPHISSTAETNIKTVLLTKILREELETSSFGAELAGMRYTVTNDVHGLVLRINGYNDKLAFLLEHVLKNLHDLRVEGKTFGIAKDWISRWYENRTFEAPYTRISRYTNWLNSERYYLPEELLASLRNVTAEDVCQFKKQILSQLHIESFAHGNLYKEDALKLTAMVETVLKPCVFPQPQWPVIRSLVISPGSNYVYKKTLEDPANVDHCIEVFLYVGDKRDRLVCAKTMLLEQMLKEPAFDQLRTKEQLGYVVFSGVQSFATTYGFRFIVQSEWTPEYLESRIEAFLDSFSNNLNSMSEADFEGHKHSLIVNHLEKPKNLDEESSRHWAQIASEYYNFELAQQDAAHIKTLTKADMVEFFQRYIKPGSATRAKLSVHLHAQASAPGKAADGAAKVNGVKEEEGETKSSEPKPVLVTDVRSFRAGLQATRGARSEKDLSEYEDMKVY